MESVSHLCFSLSGVQVDEDLQSIEVGPTLDRTEVSGSDTSGESRLLPYVCFMSDVTFDFLTRSENNKNNRINFCFSW